VFSFSAPYREIPSLNVGQDAGSASSIFRIFPQYFTKKFRVGGGGVGGGAGGGGVGGGGVACGGGVSGGECGSESGGESGGLLVVVI